MKRGNLHETTMKGHSKASKADSFYLEEAKRLSRSTESLDPQTSSLPPTPAHTHQRAVFLDRDGTIIEEVGYLSDPAKVELLPGAAEALQRLQQAGFLLFLVTNQSGIGRGYYTEEEMHRVNARLLELLSGIRLARIYYAPERPDQPSLGRKPSPAFLFHAAKDFGIDLSQSYMVGDKLSDIQCGIRAGVRKAILVRTGYGRQVEETTPPELQQAVVVEDLAAAADWILQDIGWSSNHS